MSSPRADKTRLPSVLAAFLLLGAASCNDGAKTTGDLSKNNSTSINDRKQVLDKSQSPEPMYFGEDWASQPSGGKAGRNTSASSADGAAAPSAIWTLVLGTFTDAGHADAAKQMVMDLRRVAPQIAGARVHTTYKGSLVIYGSYADRDDPAAKNDQERLKAVTVGGQRLFNRIILTRLDLRLTQGQLHPHDLLSARRAHPKVNPLYSLGVGIWMANDDPKLGEKISFDEIKRRSEAYVAQLRSQGYEAYFYHDEKNQRSENTIGLFDRTAIHPVSGLYSDAVKEILKKFPARLVNGETMYEPIYVTEADEKRAKIGRQPQTPVLVLVPSM